MAVSNSIEIHEASRLLDAIYLEAVEQAQFVFCYHAWLTQFLWSDGTPDAVSHSGGQVSGTVERSDGTPDAVSQSVGQVSGAADQVGLSHFLEQK